MNIDRSTVPSKQAADCGSDISSHIAADAIGHAGANSCAEIAVQRPPRPSAAFVQLPLEKVSHWLLGE